ncbi:hypothetical protein GOV13_03110 [Candidatus Pacearchaeota archaeon]|nr:hypothetical protein [Candidatus Pacearchaeota archaeon]
MILYFDNLITNIPLKPGVYSDLDRIRDSCKSYSNGDRYDVTCYMLASYAEIDWEEVVIVYEFAEDMVHRKKEFESFVKDLFPKAHIFYGRSDTQKKFQEKMRFVNKLKGDLVLYAGNNDHPFVSPDRKTLDACLKKAEMMCKKWEYVSIFYSHFTEAYNMAKKGNFYHDAICFRSKFLEEGENYLVSLCDKGCSNSIQIVNKNLINHWVSSKNLGSGVFRRIESMAFHPDMKRVKQILIHPKSPVCEHFDGYSHTKTSAAPIPSSLVPPLFIPAGFFENKIKIRYGYDDHKEGWVNINPLKKKYIFEEENGIDLKISLEDIPLFWKKRISKIDINKNLDQELARDRANAIKNDIKNVFMSKKNKGYNWYLFKHKLITGGYLPYSLVSLFRRSELLTKFKRKMQHLNK